MSSWIGGWIYFSDDLGMIEPASGLVHPFPKPLHVKGPYLERAPILVGGAELASSAAEELPRPPSAFPIAEAPLPAARLVFPVFRPGGEAELRPRSAAQSLARCPQNVRGEARVTPQAAATLRRRVAQAPAAELRYSSASTAVQALQEWVL